MTWIVRNSLWRIHPLGVLLVVFGLLAVIYSLYTPLFEAPDEYYHFAVIQYIAQTGKLPPRDDVRSAPWRQMAFHAPLYYLISAVLIRPIDTQDFLIHYPLNPHAQIGEPSAAHNRNFVAHVGDPWTHTGLAVRLVRLLSIGCGCATLFGVYALARSIFRVGLGLALSAVLIVLLNPQFLFINAVISNDNLVTALCTLSLALMVRGIRRGISWRWGLMIAVLLALASLAKASGLALYPVWGITLIYIAWRDKFPPSRVMLYIAMTGIAFLMIAGWWYFMNWQQYGDPTASTQVALATGRRANLDQINGELRGLYYSFWAMFGWFNIPAPQWFYNFTGAFIGLCGAGAGYKFLKRALMLRTGLRSILITDNVMIAAMLLTYSMIFVLSWWRFNMLVQAAQGRLWFPLIGIWGGVTAYGLHVWKPSLRVLLLMPLVFSAVALPFTRISPAYSHPLQPTLAPVQDAVKVAFREPWEETSCIVLWLSNPIWQENSSIIEFNPIWGADCAISGYWSVFVHLSDLDLDTCQQGETGHILSQFDSMPIGGNAPFPMLKSGYAIRDRLYITVPPNLDRSRTLYLQIGLYDAGGTFIRAFVDAPTGSDLTGDGKFSVGKCSPELVNIRLD